MKTQRSKTFAFVVVSLAGVLPVLAGCPKKEEPPPITFDAAPDPAPVETAPADLMPLEDAGVEEEDADADDADADTGPKKPAVNANVARVRQCCNALSKQAKQLGASAEAGMLVGLAGTCTAIAGQLGNSSTGVELAALRAALKGKTVPALCSGL